MSEEIIVRNQAAYIDDDGNIVIPLRGAVVDNRERKRHRAKCYEDLPPLETWSRKRRAYVSKEEYLKNRDTFAIYRQCCDTWYRPRQHNADEVYWRWDVVGKWRLKLWKKKGLL